MARLKTNESWNIWPSLTDLMSGLLLSFVVLIAFVHSKSEQLRKQSLLHQKKIITLQKQLALALQKIKEFEERNKKYGVSEDFVQQLKHELRELNPKINSYGNLEISSDLLFDYGRYSFELEKNASKNRKANQKLRIKKTMKIGKVLLRLLATKMGRYVGAIQVIGHTDSHGTWELNYFLSSSRAASIISLWKKNAPHFFSYRYKRGRKRRPYIGPKFVAAGVGKSRLKIFPETSRLCGNIKKQKGCRANRRIEIRILPRITNSEYEDCTHMPFGSKK